jgi:teichuronic acid biosynthesis glycosyltransferase TuaC
MSRQRIALMILSEGLGGAEAVVKQIARHVDRSRYDYLLVTNDEIQDYYRDTGLPVVSMGRIYDPLWRARANRMLAKVGWRRPSIRVKLDRARDRLLDVLHEHEIDLIHTHLIADHYLASLLPPDRAVRVMTMHGGLNLDVKHQYLLDRDEVLAVMDQAAFVTSACRYFLDLLRDNGMNFQGRSAIIENGIDAETLRQAEDPAPRQRDGVLRMVFLGGDRPLKGGDLLAQALGIVVNERRQTHVYLTVLRDVHPRSDMHRCIHAAGLQKFIDFAGYISNRRHIEYIKASDLFVQPSRSEGIANALMEAIGLGKAVLATDVGGTKEVVSHNVNGYLCRPSAESIADGIGFFLNDPEALGRFARRNVELRCRYLWPDIVRKYEDLYERLLTRR